MADLSPQHERCCDPVIAVSVTHERLPELMSECDVSEWIFQVMGSTVIGSAPGFKLFEVTDALHCGNAHKHINILHVTS